LEVRTSSAFLGKIAENEQRALRKDGAGIVKEEGQKRKLWLEEKQESRRDKERKGPLT